MQRNEINIRKAKASDVSLIMETVNEAKAYLRSQGHDQWQQGYPNEESFLADIDASCCYAFFEEEKLCGVMTIICGAEPAYEEMNAAWINSGKYAVIHRMAVSKEKRGSGLSDIMLDFALETARELSAKSVRIDTHRGNMPMQKLLLRNGFSYIGDADYHFEAGDPLRLVYEKLVN